MTLKVEFEKFCGGPFWDSNLTWYTDQPNFTPCFKHSVVVWTPCAFLWLSLPFYVSVLSKLPRNNVIPLNNLNITKTVTGLLLVVVLWVEVLLGLSELSSGKSPPLIAYVSPSIHLLTYVFVTILVQVERLRGFVTSGILFIFLLLETIANIVPFYTYILDTINNDGVVEELPRFIVFFIYYGLVLMFFILSCVADRPPNSPEYMDPKLSPETVSSFLSRLTFWWLNRLVWTGCRKELQEDDLFSLNPRDLTANVAPEFLKRWRAELGKYQRHERERSPSFSGRSGSSPNRLNERTPLLATSGTTSAADVRVVSGRDGGSPSIMKVMIRCYGPTMMLSFSCKLIYDVLQFVSPMLLSLLIEYAADVRIEAWKGYVYSVMFFVVAAVQSVFFHQLFHIGMTQGMRIKAAIISAIYQKALAMSNSERKEVTVGEIVNLMSVDAQRVQDVAGYLWMMWSAPLQICVSVWLLWNELGVAVMAGVAVMILLIPVNGFIAGVSRKLQIQQMKFKDARIKLMNEILNGMKVLKLYGWEESFQAKVDVIRDKELVMLKKAAFLSAIATFTWTCAPFLVTLASFGVYVTSSGEPLTSRKAFTSLALFNILRFPMNLLPMLITYIVTASVSVKRISEFLQHKDLDKDNVQHDSSARHPIIVENGTFNWGESPVLKNVNVTIPDGSLVAIVGTVGAGKSSLLSAFLGETEKEGGRVNVRGSIAYVAQQAWIQNDTLKNNVLFGEEFQSEKYDKIIDACTLGPDLQILPAGDSTEIGEKGINLSGGQKQRVALARAVYSEADIYLLDDPLSAVDSHVGKHIFEHVIGKDGLLKNKTRVLVTHGLHWLPYVDHVIVLMDGRISEEGSFDDLLSHNGDFAKLLKQHLSQEVNNDQESDPEIEEIKKTILQRAESIVSDENVEIEFRARRLSSPSKTDLIRAISKEEGLHEKIPKKVVPTGADKLIEEEKREEGKVKWSVFVTYLTALKLPYVLPSLVFFVGFWVASVWSSIFLSEWSTDTLLNNATIPTNSTEYVNRRDYYLGVYGGLGGVQAVCILIYSLGLALCMILASRRLHFDMLANILKAPMSFYDTTPIGRIVNRFSRDIETIDTILPQTFRTYLGTLFTVLSTLVIIVYSNWYFVILIVPLGIIYYFIQRVYIPTSRQLKRIESTTRSPIYVHFSETLTGVSTIRAYGYQDRFQQESEEKVDTNQIYYFAGIASNRWLGYRLEFIGSLIVLGSALFAVSGRGTPGWEGIVGLSVSYALQVTGALNFMVRTSSDLETNVVSVERVIEYAETPTEAEWVREGLMLPVAWPDEGEVEFRDYSVRYRDGMDLVLNKITFQVYGGEKVGIVGRTGAGKSSLTLSLFRILEAAGGKITIDGVDISSMGLHQLRKKITILPQDPVLFSGTLRMNLDPFEDYSDARIWTALQLAYLQDFVASKPEGLYYECGEGGQNLSVGQRQLVCLARALLRKTKILVLDEATAAVDMQTDELIQATIRREFADCTVLTIAHRLNTIMDNDRVMVLDKGQMKEFSSPASLLQDKKSVFYSMARDAGLV